LHIFDRKEPGNGGADSACSKNMEVALKFKKTKLVFILGEKFEFGRRAMMWSLIC
jgi:hypothetical protein